MVVVTLTCTEAVAPFARLPGLQVKTPPEGKPQLPTLGVADTNVTLDGSVSFNVTTVAVFGPLFVTVMV
jgi:hypothetical protein